jgi:hypothetical protein
VAFNWYDFQSIGINRVISAFSQEVKAILYEKLHKITPFD